MNAKLLQEQIDSLNYWDSEVLHLNVDYFGDEVTIVCDDIRLLLTGCSQVHIVTDPIDRKIPIKSLTRNQLAYYLQSIEIEEFQAESLADVYINGGKCLEPKEKFNLIKCKILMPPMSVEICCNLIEVKKL